MSVTAKFPYVWIKAGKAYYRRGGVVKLIGKMPTDKGFAIAYAETAHAVETKRAEQPNEHSFAVLVTSYLKKPEWASLSSVTRDAYTRRIESIRPILANVNMATLDRQDVFVLRDKLSATSPSRANEGVTVLSLLMEHAIDKGWRRAGDNPAAKVKKLRTGDGYKMWRGEDFRKFIETEEIPLELRRAVVLGYYTGLRLSDCVALTRAARKNGVISWSPQKTRNSTNASVNIPEHPELTEWLDAAPVAFGGTLLLSPSGKPWSADHLSNEVSERAKQIGLDGLTFHGLRKGLTSGLAEAGATDAEIAAVIPHANPKLTAYYRASADQKLLATLAMEKLKASKK